MFGAGDATRSGRAISVALDEAAGVALYTRNAFRVTGLSTYADRRAVRRRRQDVLTRLEVGADVDLGHDLPIDDRYLAEGGELALTSFTRVSADQSEGPFADARRNRTVTLLIEPQDSP